MQESPLLSCPLEDDVQKTGGNWCVHFLHAGGGIYITITITITIYIISYIYIGIIYIYITIYIILDR